MSEKPWIIPADGMSRLRNSDDGREMEIQHREMLRCNGCQESVLTWPGEHDRHAPMIPHKPGCRYAQRSIR
jgi:hypothetical protein